MTIKLVVWNGQKGQHGISMHKAIYQGLYMAYKTVPVSSPGTSSVCILRSTNKGEHGLQRKAGEWGFTPVEEIAASFLQKSVVGNLRFRSDHINNTVEKALQAGRTVIAGPSAQVLIRFLSSSQEVTPTETFQQVYLSTTDSIAVIDAREAMRRGCPIAYQTSDTLAFLRRSKSEGQWGFVYMKVLVDCMLGNVKKSLDYKFMSPTKDGAMRNAASAGRVLFASSNTVEMISAWRRDNLESGQRARLPPACSEVEEEENPEEEWEGDCFNS